MTSPMHRAFRIVLSVLFCFNVITDALVVKPGGPEDIIIEQDNTVNATTFHEPHVRVAVQSSAAAGALNISIYNHLDSPNVNAYVTGLDSNGALVLLQANGSWYYPPPTSAPVPQPISANVAIPLGAQGSTTNITLPSYFSAGRVWFADGTLQFYSVAGAAGLSLVEPSAANPSDPNSATNWGFIELSNVQSGLYANLSFVDFVGLPLGMSLLGQDGSLQTAQGLRSDAVSTICQDLIAQSAVDGQPWGDLCMTDASGDYLRILSPGLYQSINPKAFASYWTDYINEVWSQYENSFLTINTQTGAGLVNCTVSNATLFCDGDNRGYAQPSASDLYGCNGGPFAIQGGDNNVHYAVVPRLCAAFHRSTLLVAGGNVQPGLNANAYYQSAPTHYYSANVHLHEIDGKGYAFAYDDVTPDNTINLSGLLAESNPALLQLFVGGPGGPIASSPAASAALPSVAASSTQQQGSSTMTVASTMSRAQTTQAITMTSSKTQTPKKPSTTRKATRSTAKSSTKKTTKHTSSKPRTTRKAPHQTTPKRRKPVHKTTARREKLVNKHKHKPKVVNSRPKPHRHVFKAEHDKVHDPHKKLHSTNKKTTRG